MSTIPMNISLEISYCVRITLMITMGDGRNPSKNESEIVGKLVLTEHDTAVLRILFRLKKDQWLTIFEIVEAVEDTGRETSLAKVGPSLANLVNAKYIERRSGIGTPFLQNRVKPKCRLIVGIELGE